ncbi:MAG: hypothetical protein H7210_04625 [Pyrinomonadaceae bacterium]|nr:hypothetical protein [Phycisphaerales bacterium]
MLFVCTWALLQACGVSSTAELAELARSRQSTDIQVVIHDAVPPGAPENSPRLSQPTFTHSEDLPVRISMPTDVLIGLAPAPSTLSTNQTTAAGYIPVPSNTRGPDFAASYATSEYADSTDYNASDADWSYARAGTVLYSTPYYGTNGIRYGFSGTTLNRPGRHTRITPNLPSRHHAAEPPDNSLPRFQNGDDAHRRAQLEFHRASYPRLQQFLPRPTASNQQPRTATSPPRGRHR